MSSCSALGVDRASGNPTQLQQQSIIAATLAKQRPDGGGFHPVPRFVGGWKRADSTALETGSDGYATGLIAFALQKAGVPRDQPQLHRALEWLAKNLVPSRGTAGSPARSPRQQRDLSTDIGHFMSDRGDGYHRGLSLALEARAVTSIERPKPPSRAFVPTSRIDRKILRIIWPEQEPELADAGRAGEVVIARGRLFVAALLALPGIVTWIRTPHALQGPVGIALALVAAGVGFPILRRAHRGEGGTHLGLSSVILDVTLVTLYQLLLMIGGGRGV